VPGTHTVLFNESINFRHDGTGELHQDSVMFGPDALRFSWRVVGYGVVECQPIYDVPEIGDDGEPETADWFRLPFVIEQHSTDTGSYWVMRERDREGFWDLGLPLVPVEPVKDMRTVEST